MKYLNLTYRFFWAMGACVALFAAGFFYAPLITAGWGMLILMLLLFLADVILLHRYRAPFEVKRDCEKVLSLADDNTVTLTIKNRTPHTFEILVLDELPVQLQMRNLRFTIRSVGGKTVSLPYAVRPVIRGEYHFGRVLVFAKTRLCLAEKWYPFELAQMVPVFPSLIQMRKYGLKSLQRLSHYHGIKKLRKIGHSYEFETIKNYVPGDDYRSINWKATSRRSQLMANQYEDEKSQKVYSVIDTSRAMIPAFNGLTLMDYAINTSLVMASAALGKHDKAGLITFSDRMGTMIRAGDGRLQLKRIMEALYNEEGTQAEANFGLLYEAMNHVQPSRSLVFLYTSFESTYSAQRVITVLRKIHQRHMLVVVFFENEEILDYSNTTASNLEEVYLTTIARKFVYERRQIIRMLHQHKIQTILTRPGDLTVNTVNKYLELKARGLI